MRIFALTEEKEEKTGHNEKKGPKSSLTNTIRGYILCLVRYGIGVYKTEEIVWVNFRTIKKGLNGVRQVSVGMSGARRFQDELAS